MSLWMSTQLRKMVVATTSVKIVIPAFIKQHIVQDFMMGRSWVFILHPFPNKRHISKRLWRKPKHSHTHGQRRKLSEKLAFRDAAWRCHRHGNLFKGWRCCILLVVEPTHVCFSKGFFYDVSTFIFPWGFFGDTLGVSPRLVVGTNYQPIWIWSFTTTIRYSPLRFFGDFS